MYEWSSGKDRLAFRMTRVENVVPFALPGGQTATSVSQYVAAPVTAIGNGLIDLTSTGIQIRGSLPPTTNVAGFAATATTTSITWYWDGTNSSKNIVINRADRTSFAIPPSSLTINNLTANTWYGFLPFWTPSNVCGIGWVAGDSGSPAIAFAGGTGASFVPSATAYVLSLATEAQNAQGRESLSSAFMTYQTPAAGTNAGTPTGGGDPANGACVMLNSDIEPLGDSPYTNHHFPCNDWWRVVTKSGRSLNATPNHWVFDVNRGMVQMASMKNGMKLITVTGEDEVVESHPFVRACTKVQTKMEFGHLYYANGILSHNMPKWGYIRN